jgi:DNA repair protein RadC
MVMSGNIRKLWETVKDGYDVGDYDNFLKNMEDPKKRVGFYDTIGKEYDLGEPEEFDAKVRMGLWKDRNYPEATLGDPLTYGLKNAAEQAAGAARAADYLVNPFMASTALVDPTYGSPILPAKDRLSAIELQDKMIEDAEAGKGVGDRIGKKLDKVAGEIDAEAPRNLETLPRYNWKRMWGTLAPEIAPMGVFMGANKIPGLGKAYMGLVEAGDALASMREYEARTGIKIPVATKQIIMGSVGIVNSALESFGISTLLGKGVMTKYMKKRITSFLVKTATEGFQEGLQELSQVFGAKVYNPNVQNVLKRFTDAVYGGSLMGGMSGPVEAVGGAVDMMTNNRLIDKAQAEAREQVARNEFLDNSAYQTIKDVTGQDLTPQEAPPQQEMPQEAVDLSDVAPPEPIPADTPLEEATMLFNNGEITEDEYQAVLEYHMPAFPGTETAPAETAPTEIEAPAETSKIESKTEAKTDIEKSYDEVAKEAEEKNDGKLIGKWLLANAKEGDTITLPDGTGFEVTEVSERTGHVTITPFDFDENGNKVYNHQGLRVVSDVKLKQGDLAKLGYTDYEGNQIIEKYTYNESKTEAKPKAKLKPKKKRAKKIKDTTLRSWVNSIGRLKQANLRAYGINPKEDKALFAQVAAKEGEGGSIDDIAKQAIEDGLIPKPPHDKNPSDWFVEKLRENPNLLTTGSGEIDSKRLLQEEYDYLSNSAEEFQNISFEKFKEMRKKGIDHKTESIHTGDLKPGDTFTLGGEKFTVKDAQGDNLKLVDGDTFTVPDTFTNITIDEGSLNTIEVKEEPQGYAPQAIKESKDYFGTTSNFNEAGYLMTDGTLLDFSGKREGHPSNKRSLDHREINFIDGTNFDKFRQAGNIRISPEIGGIDIWKAPTKEQKNALKKYITLQNDKNGVIVDFENKKSIKYPKGTKVEKIFKDIENFYSKDKIQPISNIAKFHIKEEPQDYALQDAEEAVAHGWKIRGNKQAIDKLKAEKERLTGEIKNAANIIEKSELMFKQSFINEAIDIAEGTRSRDKIKQTMGEDFVNKNMPVEEEQTKEIPVSEVPNNKEASYRGVSNRTGFNNYIYGKGIYSTKSKKFASKYGKVIGIVGGIPKNPLVINSNIDFNDWLIKESGEKNIRDFNKKYKIDEFVKSKGYDGVIDGDVIVKYDTQKNEVQDEPQGYTKQTPAPKWYSKLEKTISEKMPKKSDPQTIKNILKKAGVKKEEIEWLGIDDFLEGKKSVTKDELMEHIAENQVKIEEVIRDVSSYSDAELKKIKEHNNLEDIKQDKEGNVRGKKDGKWFDLEAKDIFDSVNIKAREFPQTKWRIYTTKGGKKYRELVLTMPGQISGYAPDSYHFTEEGGGTAIAWIRFSDFTDKDGNKVMVIDEVQSKRHQDAREKGYKGTEESKERVKQLEAERKKLKNELAPISKKIVKLIEERKKIQREAVPDKLKSEREELAKKLIKDIKENDYYGFDSPGQAAGYLLISKNLELEEVSREAQEVIKRINELDKQIKEAENKAALKAAPKIAEINRAIKKIEKEELNEIEGKIRDVESLIDGISVRPPDAPFKESKAWSSLAMKRAIRWAAENGYDKIAWTPGEVQAKRYKLTKKADTIRYDLDTGGFYAGKHGQKVHSGKYTKDELTELIGKDLSKKLFESKPNGYNIVGLEGIDLDIVPEGMKSFYDKMLVNNTNKYIKKFGSRVSTTEIDGKPYHSFEITPKMTQTVLSEGQTVFEKPQGYSGVTDAELSSAGAKDASGGYKFTKLRKKDSFMERRFKKFKQLDFFASSAEITHPEDVAFIFQQLEDEAVEHLFYLHENLKGEIWVQHISSGTENASLFDDQALHAGIKEFGSARVHMVHNHPSGNLKTSDADRFILKKIKNALKGTGVKFGSAVIIDAKKNLYSTFTTDKDSEIERSTKKSTAKLKVPARAFSKKVYSEPLNLTKITGPADIASFVNASRYTNDEKYQVLIVDSALQILGRYTLTSVENTPQLRNEIATAVAAHGGNRVILVKRGLETTENFEKELELTNQLYDDKSIDVYDIISVNTQGGTASLVMQGLSPHKKSGAGMGSVSEPKRKYTATGEAGKTNIKNIPLTEMVDLLKQLTGKYPAIKASLGRALGVAYSPSKNVKLKADIFKDPELAKAVLAHEIGHIIDYIGKSAKLSDVSRGNILGRLLSVVNFRKQIIPGYPGGKGLKISDKERAKMRREAEKEYEVNENIYKTIGITADDVKSIWADVEGGKKNKDLYTFIASMSRAEKKSVMTKAMKGLVDESLVQFGEKVKVGEKKVKVKPTKEEVKKRYRELLEEELNKRQLVYYETVMDELKALTQWWHPFDETADQRYTKYRYKPAELYAEFVSVLFNNPKEAQKRAPVFFEAWHRYLLEKPTVMNEYLDIQERLGNQEEIDRLVGERLLDMFAESEETMREAGKKEITLEKLTAELKRGLIDTASDVYTKIKKEGNKDQLLEIRNAIERMQLSSGRVYNYFRDVAEKVIKPLKDAGLTDKELGAYLFYKRVMGERADLANPKGITKEDAIRQLRRMKKKMDEAEYAEIADRIKDIEDWKPGKRFRTIEKAAEEYRKIREKSIIPYLEESGMYSDELIKQMKDTKEYVTFSVMAYFDKAKSGGGLSPAIHKQIGTLNDIMNPFTATLLKDQILIRAAQKNNTTMITIKTFTAMGDAPQVAKRGEGGRLLDVKKGNLTLVSYMQNGKMHGVYMDKHIALGINSGELSDATAEMVNTLWHKGTDLWRKLWIDLNVPWGVRNAARDILNVKINMKNIHFGKFLIRWIRTLPESAREVFLQKSTPAIRELYEKEILIPATSYSQQLKQETKATNLMRQAGVIEKESDNLISKIFKYIGMPFDLALTKVNRVLEINTKIAVSNYLKDKDIGGRELTAQEEHDIRTKAGSPGYMRQGSWRRIYSALFIFSGAGKEGLRSSIESAREQGASYAYKQIVYNVIPKILQLMAARGLLTAIVAAFTDDEEALDDAKWFEEAYKAIPDYDRRNYNCVPIDMTKDGKVIYIILPTDFTGQIVGAITYDTFTEHYDRLDMIADIIMDFGRANPFSSINPMLSIANDVMQYFTTGNVYDSWRGDKAIHKNIAKEGRFSGRSLMAFAKYEWNTKGGRTIHYFKNKGVEKDESNIEKLYGKAIIGNVVKSFVRVSNRGLTEKAQKQAEGVKREEAKKSNNLNDFIIDRINSGETYKDMRKNYFEAKKEIGLNRKDFSKFKRRWKYYNLSKKLGNSAVWNSLKGAGTKKEEIQILRSFYKDQTISERKRRLIKRELESALKEN